VRFHALSSNDELDDISCGTLTDTFHNGTAAVFRYIRLSCGVASVFGADNFFRKSDTEIDPMENHQILILGKFPAHMLNFLLLVVNHEVCLMVF